MLPGEPVAPAIDRALTASPMLPPVVVTSAAAVPALIAGTEALSFAGDIDPANKLRAL
jgi:hypothetical protein